MIGVMTLLRDIAKNKSTRDDKKPFDFVDATTRERASRRSTRDSR